MNSIAKYIDNALALREPQQESLEKFSQLTEILSLEKNADLAAELAKAQKIFPKLTSFERSFPSVCFALATGIGKTRLMGACIAYLNYAKGIKNFFVIAPNLTIYKKLTDDLGNPGNPKYVFHGLDKFSKPVRIISGDNYKNFNASRTDEIIINVFNIAKLYSDSKTAQIKKLNEVLGESYFSYLQSLSDLCIFMDESHHYRAEKSFDVINELQPVLGVELTATPQIQRGAKKILFQNIICNYSLKDALDDEKFVKVPAVCTRENFNPAEYSPEQLDREKLIDGIRLHERIKIALEIYARENFLRIVKPFVLVVAKDTTHSKSLLEFIKSEKFFGGRYADKVLEINSAQRGAEKDSNIEMLLSLEKPDNQIEIVIHVNMLKEGWDVTNLYTIVPLRSSISETLTEQTIGRGLRLPYGERTGVEEIDRLSIVSHDKYEEIVKIAKDPNSLVKKIYNIADAPSSEVFKLATAYEVKAKSAINDLKKILPEEVAGFVAEQSAFAVEDFNSRAKTFGAIQSADVQKSLTDLVVDKTAKRFRQKNLECGEISNAVERTVKICADTLTENIIPIPTIRVYPVKIFKRDFEPFDLDTKNICWQPAEENLRGVELFSGKTFRYKIDSTNALDEDELTNAIVNRLSNYADIDYSDCGELLYSLVGDAKKFFKSYLSEKDAVKVLRERQVSLAEEIYRQLEENLFSTEKFSSAVEVIPASKILPSFAEKIFADKIYNLSDAIQPVEVPKKIFGHFRKSCNAFCKFDSDSERTFAKILEDDDFVLKWLRPSANQFNICYDAKNFRRYEPDFVVETADKIFMAEVKRLGEINNLEVQAKAQAAQNFCETATSYNLSNGGKVWEYILLPHSEIHLNSTLRFLAKSNNF